MFEIEIESEKKYGVSINVYMFFGVWRMCLYKINEVDIGIVE